MALLNCTTCGKQTKAKREHIGKAAKCPQCGELNRIKEDPDETAMLIQKASEGTVGRIVLSSQEILFDHVYMFNASEIDSAEAIREKAERKMIPRSSGLGFIGDLGPVLAASMAVGALESSVNMSRYKQGEQFAFDYFRKLMSIRYSGAFRSLFTISNIQFADPSLWISIDRGMDTFFKMMDDPSIVGCFGSDVVSRFVDRDRHSWCG